MWECNINVLTHIKPQKFTMHWKCSWRENWDKKRNKSWRLLQETWNSGRSNTYGKVHYRIKTGNSMHNSGSMDPQQRSGEGGSFCLISEPNTPWGLASCQQHCGGACQPSSISWAIWWDHSPALRPDCTWWHLSGGTLSRWPSQAAHRLWPHRGRELINVCRLKLLHWEAICDIAVHSLELQQLKYVHAGIGLLIAALFFIEKL